MVEPSINQKKQNDEEHEETELTLDNLFDEIWATKDPTTVQEEIENTLDLQFFTPYVYQEYDIKYDGDFWDWEENHDRSWEKSIRHGHGKIIAKENDQVLYEGLFLCGGIHGKNVKIFRPSSTLEFEGEMVCGRRMRGREYHHGGKQIWYEGEFRLSKPHGEDCIIYDFHGEIEYRGKIFYGKRENVPKNYSNMCSSRSMDIE